MWYVIPWFLELLELMKTKKPILNFILIDDRWTQFSLSWEGEISQSLEKAAETLNKDFSNKIKLPGISSKDTKQYKTPTFVNVMKAAIDFSDGVIVGSEIVNKEVLYYAKNSGKPFLSYQPKDKYIAAYAKFYDEVLVNEVIPS